VIWGQSDAYRNARRRAEKKNVRFTLSLADLESKWEEQDGKCFYTGVALAPWSSSSDSGVTIERLDSNAGYTYHNTVLASRFVNNAKARGTYENLLDWCEIILSQRNQVLAKIAE
jgi:hypothetical protein